jgi:hypothetical protein
MYFFIFFINKTMKKNNLMIAILAVALVATVGLVNRTMAQELADVNLQVTAGTQTCEFPTLLSLWQTPTTGVAVYLDDDGLRDADITCTDLQGPRTSSFTIGSSDLTGAGLLTIAKTNVTFSGVAAALDPGSCGTAMTVVGSGEIWTAPINFISKSDSSTCDWSYTMGGVTVKVPAWSDVGTYHGIITITQAA